MGGLKCSDRGDVITGPIYTYPRYRGKGYAKILRNIEFSHFSGKYKRIMCWVHKSNSSSIALQKSTGFETIGCLDVIGRFRRLVERPDGDYLIMSRPL